MSDDTLTKIDLVNMMESYKSNIEFNKQLFSSQEKILKDHGKVIDNLANITKYQEKMVMQFEVMIDKMTTQNATCSASFSTAVSDIKSVGEKVDLHNVESVKGHDGLKGHMIAVYGTLGGVVAGLLGLVWTLMHHLDKVG